jgi:hypothetical protein
MAAHALYNEIEPFASEWLREKRQRLEERIVAKFGPAGLELVEELRR